MKQVIIQRGRDTKSFLKNTRVFTKEEVTYLSTGYCEHKTITKSQPPYCNIILTNCVVCDKEMNRQSVRGNTK